MMITRPGSSARFQFSLLVMVIGLLLAGGWFTYNAVHLSNENNEKLVNSITAKSSSTITNFQECAAAGNPIQQSYPEVCVTASGQRFVKN